MAHTSETIASIISTDQKSCMPAIKNDHSSLRDTDPAVSMDIHLAQDLGLDEGDVVHIDYDILRHTLNSVDAPLDNSQLGIRYEANLPEHKESGYYTVDEDGKLAVVGVYPDNVEESQRTLQHELKHYADDTQHRLERTRLGDLLYAASFNHGSKSVAGTLSISSGLVAAEAASFMFDKPQPLPLDTYISMLEKLDHATVLSTVLNIGSLALASVYWVNASERRARKAEKIDITPALSVIKTNTKTT